MAKTVLKEMNAITLIIKLNNSTIQIGIKQNIVKAEDAANTVNSAHLLILIMKSSFLKNCIE